MDEEKSMLWQNPILTRSCLDWRVLLSSKSILSYISVSSRSSRIALWVGMIPFFCRVNKGSPMIFSSVAMFLLMVDWVV